MPTKNSINSNIPIEVALGGTGAVTLTDHGVLIGSGTGAITPLSVGGTGELLVGSAGADPAFGTSATGNFTFTSATAAQDRVLTISNTDATAANYSAAHIEIQTQSASTGDPYIRLNVASGQDYALGVDNSDSDALKITDDADPSTGNVVWKMTSAGERTMPLQPAFLAYLGSQDNNVTGDGTLWYLGSSTALTEIYDQNGDFNTNGTFTAPVTGRYYFAGGIATTDFSGTHTRMIIIINGSNRDINIIQGNPENIKSSNGYVFWNCSSFLDMDAADTAKIGVYVFNSTKTVDCYGDGNLTSYFSGSLVC